MASDIEGAYFALRQVFADVLPKLQVTTDNEKEYTLSTHVPSPFPQYKGGPLFFGCARKGKAYASFHLFPLYMCTELKEGMSPALTKRMQGKTCFNFKAPPDVKLTAELRKLTKASLKAFEEKKWA